MPEGLDLPISVPLSPAGLNAMFWFGGAVVWCRDTRADLLAAVKVAFAREIAEVVGPGIGV